MPEKTSIILHNTHIATLDRKQSGLGILNNGALAIESGRITFVGNKEDLSVEQMRGTEQIDLGGRWITPALIDCHTHLVYGGHRAHEFEMRTSGATYEEIARAGGAWQRRIQLRFVVSTATVTTGT